MLAFLLRLFWNWRPLKINWIFNNPIAVSHNVMKIFLRLSNNYWFSNFVFHKIFDVLFYSKNHFICRNVSSKFSSKTIPSLGLFFSTFIMNYDLLCNSENPLWLIHLLNISEKQRFSIFRNAAYYFKSDQFSFTNSFSGNHRMIIFQGFNYVKDFLHIIKRPSKIAHKTAFLQHSSMLLDT